MKYAYPLCAALTLLLVAGCSVNSSGATDGGVTPDGGNSAPNSGSTANSDGGGVTSEGGIILPADGASVTSDGGSAITYDGASAITYDGGIAITYDAGSLALDGGSATRDAGRVTTDGGSAPVTSGSATCADVVKCIGACASTDTTCPDVCNAQGSSEAQADVIALLRCAVNNNCSDSSCTQTACANEVLACAKQSAKGTDPDPGTGGNPGNPPPATGSVPASLVGTWSFGSSDGAKILTIDANGKVVFVLRVEFHDGFVCTVFEQTEHGIATVSGNTLTIAYSDGSEVSGTCGTTATPTPLGPSQDKYTWRVGTDQGVTALFLNNGSGEEEYTKGI